MSTKKQVRRFKRGEKVHIAKDLGQMMSHFENDVDAIVAYSYRDRFGYGDRDSYAVLILPKKGKPFHVAWYEGWQFTLLDSNTAKGRALLEEHWNN